MTQYSFSIHATEKGQSTLSGRFGILLLDKMQAGGEGCSAVRSGHAPLGGEAPAQLPREAAGGPTLQAFKVTVDGIPSNLIWWVATLYTAGQLELDDL